MDPLSANASQCCDANSGKWVPNSSGCTATTSVDVGFIGMGSVRVKGGSIPTPGNGVGGEAGSP